MFKKTISFANIFSIFIFSYTFIFAQDSLTVYKLDKDIIITANRTPTAFNDVARTVSVIDHVEIEHIAAQSIPELLENVSGVDVLQRGTQGVQADISMRGAGFNQTLILVDGTKMSDPQTGHHNMNLPVDISDIKRIEILKGPGSRLYGPNAFGGVINIITKSSDQLELSVGGLIGEHSLYNSQINFSLPHNNGFTRLTIAKAGSDGYKFNTAFHNLNVSQNSELIFDDLTFSIASGYNEKHFGANNFYIPIFPNPFQYEETDLFFLKGALKYKIENLVLSTQTSFRGHNDTYFWNKNTSSPNKHQSNSVTTEFNAQLNHKFGITSFGAEYTSEDFESNSLGIEEKRNSNGLFTHQRANSGFFVQHQVAFNQLILSVGGSLYNYSGQGWHGWPGADVSYKLSENSKIYSSYSEGFRVPTYTNLYLNFPATSSPFVRAFGNPDLKNEKSHNYEVGYAFHNSHINVEAAVFQRNDKNLIDYVFNETDTLYRAENFTKLVTKGFESSFKILNPGLGFNSLFIQYSFLDLNVDLVGKKTIYALTHFKHQIIGGLNYSIPFLDHLNQSWRIRYEDRLLPSQQTTVDTRISWKRPSFHMFLDITNILDEKYEDLPGVPMPGRWLKIGFEYKIFGEL
ncbi:MAG: TonB-dependent receptor [Calditrichaeota bacterium]|nr:MAG: TonB-dependent receptor [Calditrichota bacterium]MBL1205294.1 TonB-dependent receptor [Calditrichota bacterium]NOG45123.1 TonB-dependent receptor [Calditrichota bacterium]